MSKPKKDCVPISMKMDSAVLERLTVYCEEKGQTRTTAIERIITQHLDEYDKTHDNITIKNAKNRE